MFARSSGDDRDSFQGEVDALARLNHPNIVKLIEHGSFDTVRYLAMEYFAGGDLASRLTQGLRLADVTRVTKDVVEALDHAHAHGVIHQDIKPTNILFRPQGGAVLADFGISGSRATDTVRGTPTYMSPEQLTGGELTGQSDFYSLGIVLYRMLTGGVPFDGESPAKIALLHQQAAIPQLPAAVAPFQTVLEGLLAKRPADRFASGAEVVDALNEIEVAGVLPNVVLRTDTVATDEILVVSAPIESSVTSRGDADEKPVDRRLVYGSIAVAMVVVAGLLLRPAVVDQALTATGLRDDPLLVAAWQEAEALRADSNQSLAAVVSAYRRVLEIDAGHVEAGDAIGATQRRWKNDVRSAIETNDLSFADTRLAELIGQFPLDPELDELERRLTEMSIVDRLLTDTDRLLARSGGEDPRSAAMAIPTYQEVLRLSPGNESAQRGLDDLATFFSERATAAARDRRVDDAIDSLTLAVNANPDHAALETVRATINEAASLQAEIESMLSSAQALRAAGRLIDPPEENAAEMYQRVLATDPDNSLAVQGLAELNAQVLGLFATDLTEGEFGDAALRIERAAAVGIAAQTIIDMRERLATEQTRIARVQELLASSKALIEQGFLTEPVNDNAVTQLREILRIDPGNETAQVMLNASAARLARVAEEAHGEGLSELARQYLDLALAITPDVDAWRERRERWVAEATKVEG